MFSLIITIISIALVAALALATIYYGGSAFTQGGDAAKASQLINEGQQLQGALTLARANAEHLTLTDAADLSPKYLSQVPAGWTVGTDEDAVAAQPAFVNSTGVTEAICAVVNEKAGIATVEASLAGNKMYGCIDSAAAESLAVVYRF